ncbi:hypothetical protein GTQ40_03435 [Flavobacteriaceae bacterium R38]|nr:hypothetical protein [Flavobacteriaceae bacterium R38]
MTRSFNQWFFSILFSLICLPFYGQEAKNEPVEILILGTLHFNQFQNKTSEQTDFTSQLRQQEFLEVTKKLKMFHPDAIFVEREPKNQKHIDSLYQMRDFDYTTLKNGVSELYQIGFRLAKSINLKTVYGVDYYESVSQDLFEKGTNLQIFKDSLKAFQNKGRSITRSFLKGERTIREFLIELNLPENIKLSHRLLFNTPAYVTNGNFKNDKNFDAVDHTYIGAEYISLFYERNLKIYTNILNIQKQTHAKRIVLIIGQVHVGVLKEIIGNNPNYKVISANKYLMK